MIDVPDNHATLDSFPPLALPARSVAERALRKCGAYAMNDTGADDAEMAEALYWLEMLVSEIAGTQDCQWLKANTVTLTLQGTVNSYPLAEIPGYPTQGVTFITGAWVRDSNGCDTPIPIERRQVYEGQSLKTTSGTPEMIYVDRLNPAATLYTYPTLGAGMTGFSIRLLCQTYAPSVLAVKGSGIPTGARATGFGAEWNRFLVYALAAELGDGPVRKVEKADIKDWREVAQGCLLKLNAYSNREKRLTSRTRRYGEVPYLMRPPLKRRW